MEDSLNVRIHVDDTDLSSAVAHLAIAPKDYADPGGIHELQGGKVKDQPTNGMIADHLIQIPANTLCAVVIQFSRQTDDDTIAVTDGLQHKVDLL